MDRILYFRISGKKEYTQNYRVQVFRGEACGKEIVYLQVCGRPSKGQVLLLKEEMHKAMERVLSYQKRKETPKQIYLVYEESFTKWLESVQEQSQWRRLWKLPIYMDYHAADNLKVMLQEIPKEQYPKEAWVLGYGPDMQKWLPWIAVHLRNLTFYLEFMTRGFECLQEGMEEEYGLVPKVCLVTPGEMRKQRFRSTEPVLVIDFSGKEVISVAGLCKGSIWLDMDSIEAKRHAMEDRRTGITYISLKKIWKREMEQPLDTVGNFEYNTDVKIDSLGG